MPKSPANPPPPPLMPNEIARLEGAEVRVRSEPLRIRCNLSDLITLDGHRLKLSLSASVKAADTRQDRQMLREIFLGSRGTASPARQKVSVFVEDVVAELAPALQAAAGTAVGAKNAADWLGENNPTPSGEMANAASMMEPLKKAVAALGFSSGLEFLAPFSCEVESPSYQLQKIEALERQLAERRVAGQVEHFEKAAQMLKQFEEIRKTSPDITAGAVLTQVSPADQGAMLQTLLLAAAKERAGQALWAVAGQNLVKLDVRVAPVKLDAIALPETLGPLRSVQPGEIGGKPVLLMGARSGVMVVRPDDMARPQSYLDPEISSQMGFSRAIVWNGGIWACHGDGGIVSWTENATDRPKLVLRPQQLGSANAAPVPQSNSIEIAKPQSARNLVAVSESRLVFSVNGTLMSMDKEGAVTPLTTAPAAEILTLLTDARNLYVIHEDGTVVTRERTTLAVRDETRRSGRLTAATTLPWLGSIRLLLAGEDGAITCIGTEDGLTTQYLSPHRGLRILTAAPDVIAAVSPDRQRLVLWNSWDGKRPIADVSVYSVARHRIADVDFV